MTCKSDVNRDNIITVDTPDGPCTVHELNWGETLDVLADASGNPARLQTLQLIKACHPPWPNDELEWCKKRPSVVAAIYQAFKQLNNPDEKHRPGPVPGGGDAGDGPGHDASAVTAREGRDSHAAVAGER